METNRRRSSVCCFGALALCTFALAAGRPAGADLPAGASDELAHRIEAYLALRERAVADVPALKETRSPENILAREQALGAAIAAARTGAEPGALFGGAAPFVREEIEREIGRRRASDRRALLAELPALAAPAPNTPYPSDVAMATTPPLLLAALPTLPEALEYRLFGRHLVLRDVEANLIVDVLPEVLPAGEAR
jgi:hypothetical protein